MRVIGVPDAERGQIVKAFVVPRAGVVADEALVRALQDFVNGRPSRRTVPARGRVPRRAAAHRTGKLQRFRLKGTGMKFEREQLIRFSHCDPAAIVFRAIS